MDREAVDHLAIIGAPGTIELKKDGSEWRLVQPLQGRADGAEVGSLLTRLSSGQMQAIVAEQPATLDVYGLHPPRTTVTATGSGKTLAQVFVGSASGEAAVHMRDASRSAGVHGGEGTGRRPAAAAPSAYRAKDVFAFRMFNLSRLVVMRGDTSRTFEKKKTGTGANATETLDADRAGRFEREGGDDRRPREPAQHDARRELGGCADGLDAGHERGGHVRWRQGRARGDRAGRWRDVRRCAMASPAPRD